MSDFYITNEYWFAVFQLVLAMFGMGATLSISDFKKVFQNPISVSYGTILQLILVPLIAFVLIRYVAMPEGVAVAIALIAAIPGGSSSNFFTHFALGKVPLSITITTITTLACIATTPLILDLLISEHMPTGFIMPTEKISKEIAFTLLLPLFLGMLFFRLLPQWAPSISQLCIRGSILGLIAIFIGSASSGRIDIEAFGLTNIGIIILFFSVTALMGRIVPRALKLPTDDSIAIEMEVVVRNINLAIMLKASMFPAVAGHSNSLGDMLLLSLLLYGGVQLTVGLVLIPIRRKEVLLRQDTTKKSHYAESVQDM